MHRERDPFSIVYDDVAKQVHALQLASSTLLTNGEPKLRRQLSDIVGVQEDLAMLNATVDIVTANRQRFDLSDVEIFRRHEQVDALHRELSHLRATTDAQLKLAKPTYSSIELQHFSKNNANKRPVRLWGNKTARESWLSVDAREVLLNSKLDTLDSAVDRLGAQALTINASVESMSHDVKGLDDEMDAMEKKLSTTQARVGRLLKTSSKSEIQTILILTAVCCFLLFLLML